MSQLELARVWGVHPSTVSRRLRSIRARELLRGDGGILGGQVSFLSQHGLRALAESQLRERNGLIERCGRLSERPSGARFNWLSAITGTANSLASRLMPRDNPSISASREDERCSGTINWM